MNLTLLIFFSLATWRMSSMLAREDGPDDVLHKLRYHLGVRYDEFSEPYSDKMFGKLVLCMWCSSLWVAFVYTILITPQDLVNYLIYPLAFSSGAILIEEIRNGLH